MDEFAERLARLDELSADELESLETEMVAAFDAADAAGDVETMQTLADALDQVREKRSNAAPAEEPAPEAAPMEGETVAASAETDEPGTEETPDGEPEGAPAEDEPAESEPATPESPDAPEQPAEAPAEGEPGDAEPEASAQSAEGEPVAPVTTSEVENVAEEVTNADVPDAHKPAAVASSAHYAITAGGDIPGLTAGQQLSDMDEVIEALTRKINGMRGVRGDGEHVIVASFRRDLEAEYGEDRILRRGDPEGNSVKIRRYAAEHQSVESLTAAGWCAPRTPLYDIPGIGTTDTPVADSLSSFGVDRGGIIWQEPPTLAQFTAVMDGNFGFWKNTAAAGQPPNFQFVSGSTMDGTPEELKPCVDIPCGAEHTVELMAVPLCLCFDNLMTRANPELVRASTDLVMVAQARFREQWLLASIFGSPGVTNACSGGTGVVGTPDTPLGVARDFLITVRLAAAQFRWANRISLTTQLRLYAPAWLRDAMAADLSVQIPGDDTLSTSWAEINGYLSDINVDPVWYIDDIPVGVGTAATAATSNFDSNCGYPTPAEWLLTLPGVFTRLDGGSLDLGVVRTKEDVQKNKFCEFSETFEQVAYMGPTVAGTAWAFRGTTPVTIRGGFTPAIATVPAGGVIVE
ncbi:MAG TPA: major capsid protein [Thermomicrobiales bacterium]